jgi:uncharacterized protein
MVETLLVVLASALAGLIDAIVGGGGLVLVPVLFMAFPHEAPATLYGTNKSASVWGTSFAAAQFMRRVELPWASLWPALPAALAGGAAGAYVATVIDAQWMRRLLPLLLLAVLLYTLSRKDLGQTHAPMAQGARLTGTASTIGAVVGFYDGLFGPGTGSFFVFLFVRLLGFDFLHASAAAKLLNVATNLSALAWFAAHGHVWWRLGLAMAVANVIGSLIGTRLALRYGAGFVRQVFVVVVGSLIVKTAWDAYLR